MFVTPAFAQAAAPPAAGIEGFLVPMVAVVLIMYFVVYRPQRRAMRQRDEMLNSVKRGDTVVTGGGLVGKVTKVHDEVGEVEVDLGGATVRAVRAMLADVRNKDAGTKASAAKTAEAAPEGDTPKVKSRTRR